MKVSESIFFSFHDGEKPLIISAFFVTRGIFLLESIWNYSSSTKHSTVPFISLCSSGNPVLLSFVSSGSQSCWDQPSSQVSKVFCAHASETGTLVNFTGRAPGAHQAEPSNMAKRYVARDAEGGNVHLSEPFSVFGMQIKGTGKESGNVLITIE